MISWRLKDVVDHLEKDIPEVEVELRFGPVPRDAGGDGEDA